MRSPFLLNCMIERPARTCMQPETKLLGFFISHVLCLMLHYFFGGDECRNFARILSGPSVCICKDRFAEGLTSSQMYSIESSAIESEM